MDKLEDLRNRAKNVDKSIGKLRHVARCLALLYRSSIVINAIMSSLGMLFTILKIQGGVIGVFLSLAIINGIYLVIKLTKKRRLFQMGLLTNKIKILQAMKTLESYKNPTNLEETTVYYNSLIDEVEMNIDLENKLDKLDEDKEQTDSTRNTNSSSTSASQENLFTGSQENLYSDVTKKGIF